MDDEKRRRWYERVPFRTLAISIALIATIFLTRNRWEAWVVECELPEEASGTFAARLTPDRTRLLTYGEEYAQSGVHLWDAVSFRHLARFRTRIRAAVSPDSDKLLVFEMLPRNGSVSRQAGVPLVVDAKTGVTRHRLEGHEGGAREGGFSPDGRCIVTAGTDGTARVWDAETGRQALLLRGHSGHVARVAYSPDGSRIATAGEDGAIRLCDATTGESVATFKGDTGYYAGIDFARDGTRVVCRGGGGYRYYVLAVQNGSLVAGFRPPGYCGAYAVSPDGRRVAVECNIGARLSGIGVWNTASGTQVGRIHVVDAPQVLGEFSPDGKELLTRSNDGKVRVWDTSSGKQLLSVPGEFGRFVHDGDRIVAWDDDGSRIFDNRTREMLARMPYAECIPLRDGRLLALWGSSPVVILRRIRPEQWWGIFCLWHFWLILALSAAFAWSIWRDVRSLRRQ